MSDVAAKAALVRGRIEAAADRSGRDPRSVTLVAVTKGLPIRAATDAFDAGLLDLGENRVADLRDKHAVLPGARWHLVGQLQTNKVRHLPSDLAAIHSVDRASLIERLARHYHNQPQPALYVEVNVSGERTKAGVAPGALSSLLETLSDAQLDVIGLMTVGPRVDDPEQARPVFSALARLAAEHGISALSMGMSDDFEVAVEEGSTLVRVGRAIFA
jgi:pyridoxal phosphate enzyme (YggS family)